MREPAPDYASASHLRASVDSQAWNPPYLAQSSDGAVAPSGSRRRCHHRLSRSLRTRAKFLDKTDQRRDRESMSIHGCQYSAVLWLMRPCRLRTGMAAGQSLRPSIWASCPRRNGMSRRWRPTRDRRAEPSRHGWRAIVRRPPRETSSISTFSPKRFRRKAPSTRFQLRYRPSAPDIVRPSPAVRP